MRPPEIRVRPLVTPPKVFDENRQTQEPVDDRGDPARLRTLETKSRFNGVSLAYSSR